jgi:SAM-dependent methyltransferase
LACLQLTVVDPQFKKFNVIDARAHQGSPDRFGYSWSIFSEILPEHREQFIRWTAALPREAWKDAHFLDAGCGIGRNSHWAMLEGAAGGVAFDIDDRSLAAARNNLKSYPTMDVRNQSIYEIPEENYFDIAFSIGVIHHLAEPEAALRELTRAVKPGGYVMIWVYGRENMNWLTRYFDPIRRILFSRMPLRLVYHLSLYLTALLWLGLHLGMSRLEYFRLLRRFSFAHLRAVVFDQMIPRIAHYWPREVVERLCLNAGLENIRLVHVNEMSWSASGRKLRK